MSYLQSCIWEAEAGGWQVGQLDQRDPDSRKQTNKHTKNERKKSRNKKIRGKFAPENKLCCALKSKLSADLELRISEGWKKTTQAQARTPACKLLSEEKGTMQKIRLISD